jgi:hypothetical protein
MAPFQVPSKKCQQSRSMFSSESDIEPFGLLKGSPRLPNAKNNQKSAKLAKVSAQVALEKVYEVSLKSRGHARHSCKLSLSDEKRLRGLEREKLTLEITSGRAGLSTMKRQH